MKLRYKLAFATLAGLVLVLAALGLLLSHNGACGPAPAMSADAGPMQAMMSRCYGSPDVLTLEAVAKPAPGPDEVLVKIRAAGVNPLDWHYMRGAPYVMRFSSGLGVPADPRMGVDFAGTVETVGANVSRFKPGDEVFGGGSGAFADYLVIGEDRALAKKPGNISFAQAAAVPIAGITALQALRDKGQLQSGQAVLINGASGGVGTFAVQIAKAMGARVTAVCSTRNIELVRSLGADEVIDYTRDDYTQSGNKYDLIIDNVGNHSLLANREVLQPGGRLILVGGPAGNWLGPLLGPISAVLLSPFVGEEFITLMARLRPADLTALAELMQSGKVTPVIDRHYPLREVSEAIRYSEQGRARGKIVIDLGQARAGQTE
jgi:NADPH:quinone reductase-like Zn-dependent oxidoreductase